MTRIHNGHSIIFLTTIALTTLVVTANSDELVSKEALSSHNAADDCWIVVNDIVYDITQYIPEHPTLPDALLPWCGKDASEPFGTKNIGRSHSSTATTRLQALRVGVYKYPDNG